jgi:predicted alpha/beta-fold hydrolase
LTPFSPLFKNPHFLTIAANFAVRRLDEARFPTAERLYQTEPDVQVLVHSQRPNGEALGEIVMVHGLEGSSAAGYMRSMSQLALESGYAVHRCNLRSCGGTEALCKTMYHAGLTSDTLTILRQIRVEQAAPIFLVGYSLGGNVVLKLAGELGDDAHDLLAGVCAVSTPIDLAACVRKMGERRNRIYEWRFLSRLKERIRTRAQSMPGVYPVEILDSIKTVYDFDDRVTAPFFGFNTADNYYATQSSNQFLKNIRVPTLLVQAKDDPLIPFDVFSSPAIAGNPFIELLAVEHGGHLGFLANRAPHFWVDRALMEWIAKFRSHKH